MDLKSMSAVELAFVGDAVYELEIRSRIARQLNTTPNRLHRICVRYVNAAAQQQALSSIYEMLDETEQNIVRRGKNATKTTVPRNSSPAAYREATALEALFGWLFLTDRAERIQQLMQVIWVGAEMPCEP